MTKNDLRALMKEKRKQISPSTRQRASHLLVELFVRFQNFSQIALFASLTDEINTEFLFKKLRSEGKQIYYPKMLGDELQFIEVADLTNLTKGSLTLEPSSGNLLNLTIPTLVTLPGLAFDYHGGRVGYGKGHYDRWLSKNKPALCIGLAYDFQIIPKITDLEKHDHRLDYIVTPQSLWGSSPS